LVNDHFRAAPEQSAAQLLVDGHVHFNECFAWQIFLDAAARNFALARAKLGLMTDAPGCLMFTESAGANQYRMLAESSALERSSGWRIERGDDGRSLVLTNERGAMIMVIAGRQIVTAERLEVLALGCVHELPDGRPIRDSIRDVVDHDAVAVIPWGFGKWLGRRGRVVRDLIESKEVPFCLGDNGGRARIVGRPPLFERAERLGVPVLGGSDPLPIRGQAMRAGSYGFILDAWRATSRPAPAIASRIRKLRQTPPGFGELSSAASMLRAQFAIRWTRRGSTQSLHPTTQPATVASGRRREP
jgi:hypothetical protein